MISFYKTWKKKVISDTEHYADLSSYLLNFYICVTLHFLFKYIFIYLSQGLAK